MRIYSNKKRPVKASKDYADFTGKDFDTAKAQLEKDGYKEHEYGDTKEGNGYAVYRKGDKEVELTYKWVGTKNKAHAGKVLDVYVDEDINGACGKKSVKASTAGTIPYDLVSMLVALRDYISIDDTDYINDEHRKLVDVADSLYNAGITVAEMSPEYQAVYNKYGKDFFDLVLDDVAALDTQITANNVNDLIEDYNDREASYTGVNASTKHRRNTKAIKASYDDRQILWVLDGNDNTWKCWGFAPNRFTLDIDHPDHQDPDELLEDLNYRNDANYTDYIVTYNGENPDDYGRTEPIKDKFVKASQTSFTSHKSVKAASEYTSPNADVIAVLEDNGFEYSNEPIPWWDKYMWLGFGATYNDETEQAYVWWNPNGNAYELPFNYSVETVSDAKAMCDDLYTWDEYDIAELLNAGLPLIGATSYNNRLDEWEYDNGMGDKAYINTDLGNGYVIDVYGEKTEYSNLQDLLEAASIIR